MDYFNKVSILATQESYNEALNKLLALCPNVEPSANEYNSRVVMPTSWRPLFGFKREELLRHVNHISTRYEHLFDFDNPKVISKNNTIWKERWFIVYCAIQFPFSIYGWEMARQEYPEGYDDDGNPIGKCVTIPANISEWCSPQHITLEVYDGVWDKAWALKDWSVKYNEIVNFSKQFESIEAQANYAKGLLQASKEVAKWEEAISRLQELTIPNTN